VHATKRALVPLQELHSGVLGLLATFLWSRRMWCPEPLAADTAAEVRSPSVAARAASARMRRCGAFVHVSSAYANGHLPRGRLVRERLYPPPGAGAGLLAAL